ncbi:MAG: PD-(D/E)XK nuclease family protein [Bacteroidales bacterium]|nr:PD-(D/E)XK nuclease family protein [Bacteroidales bacterium]
MEPFLKQVARHYMEEGTLERKCFVFPSRRSMVFFRKYLSESVSAGAAGAIVAPMLMTVSDFFEKSSSLRKADRISQLLCLYECYSALYPHAESLDEFIFWGDVILGDFSDVDKYLADPTAVFTNVADLKDLQDDFSHLSPKQREALERFTGYFDRHVPSKGHTDVKGNFAKVWNILAQLYVDFNESLRSKGLASEGQLYRSLAERCDQTPVVDLLSGRFPHTDKFIFVGLTAPNACEKKVFRKMRDASLAEFCWDYSGDMIKDPKNKSSFFLSKDIKMFGQAFKIDPDGLPDTKFNVVSVSSAVGQTKLLSKLLEGADENQSAVVLPDESLLFPLLDSVPEGVENVNVTMGCPMSSSRVYSLMRDIARMQLHIRMGSDGSASFYHKQVWDIISDGVFKQLTASDEKASAIIAKIKKERKYYIPQEDLQGHPLFDLVFRPVIEDMKLPDAEQIKKFSSYQAQIALFLGSSLKKSDASLLEIDFAKEYYCSLTNLSRYDLAVLPATYVKLLDSLLRSVSVPFNGEPLKGLQVMGPLETRLLDFKNVVILCANEGVFPRRNVSSSFIPSELRKGFDLPTYEFQDAMWAYYFYRLVCRAENVWMVYDSRTEGMSSGEESRFVKQLEYHFHVPLNRYVATSGLSAVAKIEKPLEKGDKYLETLSKARLSASSLSNYLDCPAKFYYRVIKGLKAEKEVAENLDAAMIGNVYHNTMRALYLSKEDMLSSAPFDKLRGGKTKDMERVDAAYLRSWLTEGGKKIILDRIKSFICHELGTPEVKGRNLVTARVIEKYVIKTVERDLALLKEQNAAYFEIVGLELPVDAVLGGFKFTGVIDRVDRVGGSLRVVDYQTGKDADPPALKVAVGHDSAIADKVFSDEYKDRKAVKAVLQFHIYDKMLREKKEFSSEKLHNCMYSALKLLQSPIQFHEVSKDFTKVMDERLNEVFDKIADPATEFTRTSDLEACGHCDYKILCGR